MLGLSLDASITKEEIRLPAVRRELEQRLRRTIHMSSLTVAPTVALVVALLWPRTDQRGLVLWAFIAVTNAAWWVWHLTRPAGPDWLAKARIVHLAGGVGWGLLPVFAMPRDEAAQLLLGAFLLGVMAANVLFSSQIRQMYYIFHMPVVVLTVGAYLIGTEGTARWTAGLLAYGAVFAISLSEVNHGTELSAAVFAVRSARLAAGLEREREALHEANARLAEQARTDPLTGLSNRLDFTDRLGAALDEAGRIRPTTADGSPAVIGVAYLDLDGFKAVNDTLGHRVGDLLLVAVARRLSERLRCDEVLARLGGDELVVLSPRLAPRGGPAQLGNRLLDAFGEPFTLDGRRVTVGTTVGVAIADDQTDADELLRFADVALYRGKANGGRVVEIFDANMRAELRRREEFEEELELAFWAGDLVPWYQPVVDLHSGRVVAAEALVRWMHPSGVRSAASFVDAAANRGLLSHISQQLVATAADYRFAAAARSVEPIDISVNAGHKHLEAILEHHGGEGALEGLTIEINDGVDIGGPERAEDLVRRVRAAGAKVFLDGFGSGAAALSMAMDLEVDGYKLDQRLVAGLTEKAAARAVVAAVSELARRQGRIVVAKGVETEEQAAQLRELGIGHAQGYLFAPPMAIEELETVVAERSAAAAEPLRDSTT